MALRDKGLLSVFTCKAITWEILPLPGILTMTELIYGDEEQVFAFSFYMQSNNMRDLTLARDFRWQS